MCIYFSHSMGCFITLVSLWYTKVLYFNVVQFILYFFCLCVQWHIQEIISKSSIMKILLFFYCRSSLYILNILQYFRLKVLHFYLLHLGFWSILFIFVYDLRVQYHSFSCACGYPVFPKRFVGKMSFPIW